MPRFVILRTAIAEHYTETLLAILLIVVIAVDVAHPVPGMSETLTALTGGLLGYIGKTVRASISNTDSDGSNRTEVSKSQS
jgi:hypothetical protein